MSLLSQIRSDMKQTVVNHEGGYKKAPHGEYEVIVSLEEREPDEYKSNPWIKAVFEITEGDYAGAKFFDDIQPLHENPQVAEIAMEKLVRIAISNQINPNEMEVEDLNDKTCRIKVAANKKDPKYNTITLLMDEEGWENFEAYKASLKEDDVEAEEKPAAKPAAKKASNKPDFLNN